MYGMRVTRTHHAFPWEEVEREREKEQTNLRTPVDNSEGYIRLMLCIQHVAQLNISNFF